MALEDVGMMKIVEMRLRKAPREWWRAYGDLEGAGMMKIVEIKMGMTPNRPAR